MARLQGAPQTKALKTRRHHEKRNRTVTPGTRRPWRRTPILSPDRSRCVSLLVLRYPFQCIRRPRQPRSIATDGSVWIVKRAAEIIYTLVQAWLDVKAKQKAKENEAIAAGGRIEKEVQARISGVLDMLLTALRTLLLGVQNICDPLLGLCK